MDLDRRDSPRVREVLGRLTAANRPADAVLAEVAPGFAVGGDRDDATVLEVVRDRAEAVTEFMLDPTRARRSDRVGDVEHSRSATPWRDLEGRLCLAGERGGAGGAGAARHGSRSRRAAVSLMIASGGEAVEMEHRIRFAAVVMVAVAGSLAFSGLRLSGSVMFAGRAPWDALMVLVVVLPVYVGVVHAVPTWSSMVVALVGLGCLMLGSTSQLLLSVGAVLLLIAVADAGSSAAAFHAAGL